MNPKPKYIRSSIIKRNSSSSIFSPSLSIEYTRKSSIIKKDDIKKNHESITEKEEENINIESKKSDSSGNFHDNIELSIKQKLNMKSLVLKEKKSSLIQKNSKFDKLDEVFSISNENNSPINNSNRLNKFGNQPFYESLIHLEENIDENKKTNDFTTRLKKILKKAASTKLSNKKLSMVLPNELLKKNSLKKEQFLEFTNFFY